MKRRIRLTMLLVTFTVVLPISCATSTESLKGKPAHHTQDGFKNLYIDDTDKGVFSFLRAKWFGDEEFADFEALASTVVTQPVNINQLLSPSHSQVTWLGHSTFLIQIDGLNILTDPIFADRASPVSFAGPKRYIPHVVDYDQLPEIDHVVISHNHYDHLDEKATEQIKGEPIFHVPLGLKSWYLDQDIPDHQINEYDWWQQTTYSNVTIKALPSQHWSARGLFDRRETLWASWAIEVDGFQIWFAGDTGYNDVQFKEIGADLKRVDLALIPIGAYAPRWFMKNYHVNPEEAIKIHQDVRARLSIGMHWGAFPLSAEGPLAPKEELERQLEKQMQDDGRFITIQPGQSIDLR